jgi:hypothetical protein
MRRVLILMLFLLSLISCNIFEDYPKTYVYDGFEIGEIKLYTNSGAINDSSIIHKSLGTIKNFSWFEEPHQSYQKMKIEFLSRTKAIGTNLFGNSYPITITRKNGILYLEEGDTLTGHHLSIVCDNDRFKYSPLYYECSPTTGESKMVNCTYLIEEDGVIFLPIVYYYEKFEFPHMQSFEGANNVFNENYFLTIEGSKEVDTIAYQNCRIIFKEE